MARCVTAAQKHVQEVAEAMMGSVDSSSIVQVASCDRLTTLLQVGVCLCLCVCVCVCTPLDRLACTAVDSPARKREPRVPAT